MRHREGEDTEDLFRKRARHIHALRSATTTSRRFPKRSLLRAVPFSVANRLVPKLDPLQSGGVANRRALFDNRAIWFS